MAAAASVTFENVSKQYSRGGESVRVLENMQFMQKPAAPTGATAAR